MKHWNEHQTFWCYMEDLQEVVTSFEIKYHLYADSFSTSQPSKTWMPVASGSRAVLNQFMNGAQAADLNWILIDRIDLARSMLSKLQGLETGICVDGVQVKPVESVRDLGVTLDCQLNMRTHISKIVSAWYYYLCRIRQLRHCLDKDDRQKLLSALVLLRINYCKVALVGLLATSLAPLQQVINAAACFVANFRPRDHVSLVLRDLHWLPIREQISYKVYLMMFNNINGTAPTYMTGMVTRISDLPGRCHLCSAAEGLFDVPCTRTVFGSWAFSVTGLVAWNGLPTHVRAISRRYCFQIST